MDSEKSMNSFEKKRNIYGHFIIYGPILFLQFPYNFSAFLLCKIYLFEIFNMVDFFQIFIIS